MKVQIKLLVMDVDGTLTDGKIYMGNDGEVMKAFSIKDGYGIQDLLIPAGITPVIITGRTSKLVENRCKEIGITELHQGVRDKVGKLKEILAKYGSTCENVAFIGDDMNDYLCMTEVKSKGGIIGCPADACKQVIEYCDYVSGMKGGEGAVRDFIEYIFTSTSHKCSTDMM
jgi:3-deoxy-D-manno-octulosonate 8-phosphate phosphatase (KDO 8-P phosphatase)